MFHSGYYAFFHITVVVVSLQDIHHHAHNQHNKDET